MATERRDSPFGLPRGFWPFATVLCVVLLGAFVVHRSDRGLDLNVFNLMHIVIAPEDDFVQVSKMLRGEDHDEATVARILQGEGFHRIGGSGPIDGPTEAVLESRGFHEIATERPIDDHAAALLQAKGFYHIASQDLIDAIRRFEFAAFDPDREVAEAKAARLRSELLEMMGRLEGPFELPGTLSGATGDFIGALEELDAALRERREVGDLLAVMWERSLKHQPPFTQHWLRAEVEVLPEGDGPAGRILACPQNDVLDGKYVQLVPLVPGSGQVELRVEHDRGLFACDQHPAMMVPEMLAGEPVRLAISAETARDLIMAGREGPMIHDRFEAEFQPRPAHLASAGLIETGASK